MSNMPKNAVKKLKLPPLLLKIGALAEKNRLRAFLIGGSVRDMLSGAKNLDWDISVEGDPSSLVNELAGKLRGKVKSFPEFGTHILSLPGNKHMDFATARTEIYREPAALPVVKFGLIERDMLRRDFSINTLALPLNGRDSGIVLDICGGLKDLKTKTLRALHERSFRDDPTRIFRLARFAGRGYEIEEKTAEQVLRCVNFIDLLSPARVREELYAILKEEDPRHALILLVSWGIIGRYMPEIIPGLQNADIKKAKTAEEGLALLLAGASRAERRGFLDRFMFERKTKQSVEMFLAKKAVKPPISGKDLIKHGYKPGPQFKTIMETLSRLSFASKKHALRFVFDKFPRKK